MALKLPTYVLDLANEARDLLLQHLDKGDKDTWTAYLVKRDELAAAIDLDPAATHTMLVNGDFNA